MITKIHLSSGDLEVAVKEFAEKRLGTLIPDAVVVFEHVKGQRDEYTTARIETDLTVRPKA